MPTRSRTAPTHPDAPATGRRRRPGERGTSAVEFAIVTPVFLALIFLVIFGALYYHAANTAQSAAREGASYLRLAGTNTNPSGYVTAAEQLAEAYAHKIGRLQEADARGVLDEDGRRVTMYVTGTVDLPLLGNITVEKSARATLEQWVPDQ